LETALMIKAAALGAEPVKIDLNDYDMPLFHGDLKPAGTVQALIDRLNEFEAVVIVTPEYNGSLPPLLKNTLDWTSTVETSHITGPVYGIAACTPGPMSGIMCLRQLHYILTRLGAEVVPTQVGCGNASKAFDGEGRIAVEPTNGLSDKMLAQLIERAQQKRG
ncbi:MAG: NADPH-dependent FMN reductase, partial [Pseudomonadota bacterium]